MQKASNKSGEVIIAVMLFMCIPLFLGFYHERKCLKQDAIDREIKRQAQMTNTFERIIK